MVKELKILGIMALITVFAVSTFAAEEKHNAKVITVNGKAEMMIAPNKSWLPVKAGMVLSEGDVLRTMAKSGILLNVDGKGQNATVDIKENTQLLLAELLVDREKGTEKTLLDLAMGEVLIKAQKIRAEESKFEVKTPTSIVGVRGTTFAVKVEAVEE